MTSTWLWMWLGIGLLRPSHAHYIQIDHEEFRASGYPHPPLPPAPLTPLELEHLPHVVASKQLTPGEVMVDLTNDLTHRLLHYHAILNRNNFAFSPTALVSVLVALYEGSSGRSATELRNVLQLPNNRDVIRVGYRDIHRRLRTYFFGSDNPLKGLSLSRSNVTVLKDFETVLMFYGYDLSIDMRSSTPANITTDAQMANTTVASNATAEEMQDTTTPKDEETTTTTELITTTTEVTTTIPTTTTTEETTTIEAETTTTEATETTSGEAAEDGGEDEAAELVSAFVAEEDAEPFLRIQKARVSRLPTSKLQAPLKHSNPITPKPNYLPSARISIMPMMERQVAAPLQRRMKSSNSARQVFNTTAANPRKSSTSTARHKRHVLGYKELDANLFVALFNPHAPHGPPHPLPIPSAAAFAHITNDFEPHFISDGAETKTNYNTDVISHVFYLGNQQVVHTTFKVYNAVLYYKYFEHLKMSVLELELDTPEYNLMILLPDYHMDIVAAAASLKLGPTLRLMRKQLKPRWVQAIIPDFKLHGTMFLTNDLQNMGICDIFEPNRADFRPMTDEKGVYVRHIEQSIDVNIRTHPINQLKRNSGAQTKPIQISVNHPFLFFIIDRDLDVAVMSGRILNPLNVRIQ
ncbi:GH22546 [Drosophila grimshawi]|uniref:GH22546 n=2 Tax=Drosophila grimshawi TaxID=7222 RepID=B4JSK2_DROGR|nr:GH22546 [Drosophila grimshawi]